MKILENSFLLIIWSLLLFSCKHESACSCFEDSVYLYPNYICPGTSNVNCWEERIKSLQLPDQYLECSSTDSLTTTCFNYPLIGIIWLYSSIQEGFDHVELNFNGFTELFYRNDKNRVFIKVYQDIDPLRVTNFEDPIERGQYMSYITFVEITLSQYDVVNFLTIEETKSLLEIALKKYSDKASVQSYSWVGAMSTVGLLGRILCSHNYKPFMDRLTTIPDLNKFINSCDFTGINNVDIIIQTIISDSENYLNEIKK
ncbi:MAG: hypothetical protein WCS03_12050 [Bacteroidota bacterium]